MLRVLESLADVLGFAASLVARVMLAMVAAILFLQVFRGQRKRRAIS